MGLIDHINNEVQVKNEPINKYISQDTWREFWR